MKRNSYKFFRATVTGFCALLLTCFAFNLNAQSTAPQIVQTATNISYETYGNAYTPLYDWVEDNGGAVVIPAAGCGAAQWSNNFEIENFNSNCGNFSGSISVTFTYTDDCDNVINYTRTATLSDTTPPTCVKPFDLVIDCSDPDFEETLESYGAYWGPVTDLNHPITITSSYSEDGFDDDGVQVITWTFADACGNTTTLQATVTVTGDCECIASAGTLSIDQNPVQLSGDSAQISASTVVAPVVPDGYTVIYVLTSGANLVIEQTSATPSFTVNETGDYTIHTLVYDPATLDLSTIVLGTTTAGDILPLFQENGGTICASLDATGAPVTVEEEPCVASAGSLTIDQNPVELTDGSAQISATVNVAPTVPEGYEVIYVLTEDYSDLIITQTSAIPSFTVNAEGQYTIHTLVYDPATLDLSIIVPGSTSAFEVLPLFQENGGTICASLDAQGAQVVVNPETPTVITITPPTTIDIDCTDALPEGDVTATTTCPDGEVTITETEEFTSQICSGTFTFVRTFTATDNCGNVATTTVTINSTDTTPPVFSFVPEGGDVNCTAYPDGFGEVSVGDACGEVTLTFEDELAPYVCDADFPITRVWTATDECGNVATASQTLIVWPDVEAPVFTFVPADMVIECPAEPEFGEVEVEDACLGFTVTEEITSTGTCPEGYTTTKTWTAIDECGNAASVSQTITVQSEPTPIVLGFTALPVDKTAECGAALEFDAPTCESNCADGFTVETEDIVDNGTCADGKTHTRRWTATDACGNTAVCEQTITTTDTTAPEFLSFAPDKTINCDEEVVFGTPAAADLCGGVTLTFADAVEYSDCEDVVGSYTRTWTATDDCGNAFSRVHTLTVVDDVAPTFNIESQNLEMSFYQYSSWSAPEVNAFDECSDVSMNDMHIYTHADGRITHSWIAYDACGNKSSVSITVTLSYIENPELPGGGLTAVNGFTTFPNPTGGDLTLNYISNDGNDAFIEVIDMQGRTLQTVTETSYKGTNSVRLDLNDYVKGTYLVRLTAGGETFVQRVLKF